MLPIRNVMLAAVVASTLLLGACGDDDTDDSSGASVDEVDTPNTGDSAPKAPAGSSGGGMATFGDEEITIERVRCFFEEQPRAGLGGVFTHTAQADGVNAAGEQVVIDLSRARGEDGDVSDEVRYGVGDPFGSAYAEYSGGGAEGTVDFGDDAASATDVALTNIEELQGEPVLFTFDLSC